MEKKDNETENEFYIYIFNADKLYITDYSSAYSYGFITWPALKVYLTFNAPACFASIFAHSIHVRLEEVIWSSYRYEHASRVSKKIMTLYDRAQFLEIRFFFGALSRRAARSKPEFDDGLWKLGFDGGYLDQVAFRNAKGFDMKYKVVAIRIHWHPGRTKQPKSSSSFSVSRIHSADRWRSLIVKICFKYRHEHRKIFKQKFAML